MKSNQIFVIILLITSINLVAQDHRYDYYELTFEDSTEFFRLSYEPQEGSNIWEIGTPQKHFFTSAKNGKNVICTDLDESYPINNSASFIIKHIPGAGYFAEHTVMITGYYKVDCDSLNDFGKIEFSGDMGYNWLDLIGDTIDQYYVNSTNPILTGFSNWTYFRINLERIGELIDILDTVYYKFSFISDAVFDDRDGLMFDDLYFDDWAENVKDYSTVTFSSKAFPNPGSSQIEIAYDQSSLSEYNLQIFNSSGKLVYFESDKAGGNIKVDVSRYERGMYLYRLMDIRTGFRSSGKFLVDP